LQIKKVFAAILAFACLAVAYPGAVSSEDDVLTVVVIHIPPFVDLKSDPTKPAGLAIDATTKMAMACGLRVQFIQAPAWSRVLAMAKSGTVDALTPTLVTDERLEFLDFSADPITRLDIALFASTNSTPVTTESLSILDGKRIGRLIGIATEKRIDAYIKGGKATLVKHMTYRSLLDNLTRGRVDFVVGPRLMVEHAITDLGAESEVMRLTPDLGQVIGHLAFPKNRKTSGNKERKIRECILQTDLPK